MLTVALLLLSTNALAIDTNNLEAKLPLTFEIAADPQKAGICIAANSAVANEVKDFREPIKKVNAILWSIIDEKQGKQKADIIEEIATEWATALDGNLDFAIRQMKSNGCSEMNNEIGQFLQK
jgi:hypothetical protein